ncbi:DNA-(apurinic or apyrimidinic site) lyase, partial [Caligus rogercresseyi]
HSCSQVSKATPAPKVSKATPASKVSKATPASKVSKATPASKVSKATPASKMSKTTPDSKITSWNVDGLRAWIKKGCLSSLLETEIPDILCLQETKCSESKLPAEIK